MSYCVRFFLLLKSLHVLRKQTRRARNFINMAYFRKKDACFFILSPHGEKYMACRKKHKAHILKYKPYILKYMPYIFENLKHMIHNNLHSSSIFLSSF